MPPQKPVQSRVPHHRVDAVDALWNWNAEKYNVACRTLHVTRATLFIGYTQLGIITFFTFSLLFYYGQALHGKIPHDSWLAQSGTRYLTSLMTAVFLQLTLALMLMHGVRREKRSFLLPYIVFAGFALVIGFAQIFTDVMTASYNPSSASVSLLMSHLVGMMIHLWCLAVVWRCYCYFGDKKVAEHIGAQLEATSRAFTCDFSQPPPYELVEKHPLTIA